VSPQRRGLVLEALAGRKDDESRKAALKIITDGMTPVVKANLERKQLDFVPVN